MIRPGLHKIHLRAYVRLADCQLRGLDAVGQEGASALAGSLSVTDPLLAASLDRACQTISQPLDFPRRQPSQLHLVHATHRPVDRPVTPFNSLEGDR